MLGAEAIVVSSSESRLEHPCWNEQVMEIAKGCGVDVVVETGGEKTLPPPVRSLRTGGRIAVVGYVTERASISTCEKSSSASALSCPAIASARAASSKR